MYGYEISYKIPLSTMSETITFRIASVLELVPQKTKWLQHKKKWSPFHNTHVMTSYFNLNYDKMCGDLSSCIWTCIEKL